MARMMTDAEIHGLLREGAIGNGLPACVEGIKYDFRLGRRVLLAGGARFDTDRMSEQERARLGLEPGEMAFVTSEETLDLPADVKVELSQKRKLAHCGILVAGGFCVDPLYKGRLILLLYNFSGTRFPLIPGRKIIAGIFYRLLPDERPAGEYRPQAIDDFPDDVQRLMSDYEPLSLARFNLELESLWAKIRELERDRAEGEAAGVLQDGRDPLAAEIRALRRDVAGSILLAGLGGVLLWLLFRLFP
jgi:deoxycytidine triphosphate deaminase